MGLNRFLTFKTTEKTHYHLNKVRKRAKIRNLYNQAPHLTQDTNGKVTTSQLDVANESQEFRPFLAGDHNASKCRHDVITHSYVDENSYTIYIT